MPHSRPLPAIGSNCHELRIVDETHNWRIVYRTDTDAVVISEVFDKKTRQTPAEVIARCRERLGRYDEAARGRTRK